MNTTLTSYLEPETVLYANGRAIAPSAEYARSRVSQVLRGLKVSIVLPCFNHGAFLESAIQSVFSSSLVSIELIIINDGSTDTTREVLSGFKSDPRIRVVHQENQGLPTTLNRGFALATGALLGWTSADNRYLEGAIDRLSAFLLLNPSIDLTYADVELIDETSEAFCDSDYRVGEQQTEGSNVLSLPLEASTLGFFSDNFLNACILFRRELLEAVGPHKPELLGFEDYDFWLRAAQTGRIAHLDERTPLYQYRLHRNSLSAQLDINELAKKQEASVARSREVQKALTCGLDVEADFSPEAAISKEALSSVLASAGHRLVSARTEKSGDNVTNARTGQGGALRLRVTNPAPSSLTLALTDGLSSGMPLSDGSLLGRTSADLCASGILRVDPEGAKNHDSAFWPACILLSPILLPEQLRRARDSNFGAVSGSSSSIANLLLFVPDHAETADTWIEEYCLPMLENTSSATFVLYCTSPTQRAIADRLNVGLSNNQNLRIVDCSEQDVVQREKSLLYVLSSVHGILSLDAKVSQVANLLELRIEAALSAIAGIRLIRLRSGASSIRSRPENPTMESMIEDAIRSELSQIPHLEYYAFGDFVASAETFLRPELNPISLCSLDQYLERCSPASFGHRLASLFFCRL